ncbi:protein-tyrosine phosphatase family protein [Desulfobaculum bizertense]|uniref:Dual specificity phosphatase, catalytic domain n=1 Tax=Desulfobaculum bizertense DSM 18034 TaxID=1121442 RepID=A0A1T4VE46_9BACT|nr:dual specificity protein phosphatase family protein [Desulfobaculum bizertense]UIJ37583.1 dual specificity protein phosphatase family protein [Desulfobaculum bizertense]SKA62801.1 Dual specificity phosphatase, catalytic domain [Desulfobaculum bizertense DSM 18034]
MAKPLYPLTWVTSHLAVGGAPMSYPMLDAVKSHGVDAILNLCDEFCDLHWIEADHGFDVYYFPIPDEQSPDLEGLEKALEWLDEAIYLGKRVLIHCRHGIGRTGTVLNAYLLRRGLSHAQAARILRPLRAKPQNFQQWRFVRRYGKKENTLTIREPSIEIQPDVDLGPFFRDYEAVVASVNERLTAHGVELHCGAGHSRCCYRPLSLSLIETVYVHHAINTTLSQPERESAITRATGAFSFLRKLGYHDGQSASIGPELRAAYTAKKILCPLNELGECRIFAHRPLACRVFDLPEGYETDQFISKTHKRVAPISESLFLALSSRFIEGEELRFALPSVISGRFVQTFFHLLPKPTETE